MYAVIFSVMKTFVRILKMNTITTSDSLILPSLAVLYLILRRKNKVTSKTLVFLKCLQLKEP